MFTAELPETASSDHPAATPVLHGLRPRAAPPSAVDALALP